MKKISLLLTVFLLLSCLMGCSQTKERPQIVATTLPVYEFTERLCAGTELTVGRLVTEEVSCLHDYTLQVSQMRMIEGADLVITSGAGLETFLLDTFDYANSIVDSSLGVDLLTSHSHCDHEHHHEENETDPHIWLSAENAVLMANNIFTALCHKYPQYEHTFTSNYDSLVKDLKKLDEYGKEQLSDLSNKEIITFHDGFTYFADQYGLEILRSVEEEPGSEISAAEIIELLDLIETHQITAIFTERSGSTASASVIASELALPVYSLDMAMSGDSYFDAMYYNINTLKEALK